MVPNYLTTVSEYAREAVCCGPLASRTVTVRPIVPATVGVPKTAPEEELIPTHWAGPKPTSYKACVPPVAATACIAAYPTSTVAVAGLSEVVAIENAAVAAATVSDSTFEAVCCGLLLSVTVTVRLNVPEAVGAPSHKATISVQCVFMGVGRKLAHGVTGNARTTRLAVPEAH
jgi:hypothetical protein